MQRLQTLLNEVATKGWPVEQSYGSTWVSVPRSAFKTAVQVWKEQGFNYLANIIGIDYLNYPEKKLERFCVTYELVSMPGFGDGDGSRVFVRVFVPESDTKVPSLTDLWAGADFLEREVYDMFGIHFEGHPDLRKILTPEDLEGYPLRKDFPLGETPTLFKEGRFIDPAAFRAGLSGNTGGLTGWRGGSRRGYQEVHEEIKKVAEGK